MFFPNQRQMCHQPAQSWPAPHQSTPTAHSLQQPHQQPHHHPQQQVPQQHHHLQQHHQPHNWRHPLVPHFPQFHHHQQISQSYEHQRQWSGQYYDPATYAAQTHHHWAVQSHHKPYDHYPTPWTGPKMETAAHAMVPSRMVPDTVLPPQHLATWPQYSQEAVYYPPIHRSSEKAGPVAPAPVPTPPVTVVPTTVSAAPTPAPPPTSLSSVIREALTSAGINPDEEQDIVEEDPSPETPVQTSVIVEQVATEAPAQGEVPPSTPTQVTTNEAKSHSISSADNVGNNGNGPCNFGEDDGELHSTTSLTEQLRLLVDRFNTMTRRDSGEFENQGNTENAANDISMPTSEECRVVPPLRLKILPQHVKSRKRRYTSARLERREGRIHTEYVSVSNATNGAVEGGYHRNGGADEGCHPHGVLDGGSQPYMTPGHGSYTNEGLYPIRALERGLHAIGVPERGLYSNGVSEGGFQTNGVPERGYQTNGVPERGYLANGVSERVLYTNGIAERALYANGGPKNGTNVICHT